MKMCSRCHEVKREEDFYRNSKSRDGLQSHCSGCADDYARDWQRRNPKKVAEYQAKWYEKAYEAKAFRDAKDEIARLMEIARALP